MTSDLASEEISCIDDNGNSGVVDSNWHVTLLEYLAERYDAVSVSVRLPYLVVQCQDEVPALSERPFRIAGLIFIWLGQEEEEPLVSSSSYTLPCIRLYTNQ